jgi:hypothetical protein
MVVTDKTARIAVPGLRACVTYHRQDSMRFNRKSRTTSHVGGALDYGVTMQQRSATTYVPGKVKVGVEEQSKDIQQISKTKTKTKHA